MTILLTLAALKRAVGFLLYFVPTVCNIGLRTENTGFLQREAMQLNAIKIGMVASLRYF